MKDIRRHSGFTIVELLIVVVVIAILAAVTIVAYNGIAQRASASNAQSTIESVAKRLEVDKIEGNGSYPASLALANKGQGFSVNEDINLEYTSTATTYCLTVGSVRAKLNFYKNNDNAVTSGKCSGHLGYAGAGSLGVAPGSVFGSSAPSVSFNVYNDGGGGLWVGTRFYSNLDNGVKIFGVRVWEPPTADQTFLSQNIDVRGYLQDWTGSQLPGWHDLPAPSETATYTGIRTAGTWTTVIFDQPIVLSKVQSSAGTLDAFTAAVKYRGGGFDGTHYIAPPTYLSEGPVGSINPAGIYIAEIVGFGRGVISITPSGAITTYYGIDVLFQPL